MAYVGCSTAAQPGETNAVEIIIGLNTALDGDKRLLSFGMETGQIQEQLPVSFPDT
jgi:hypothetical protein